MEVTPAIAGNLAGKHRWITSDLLQVARLDQSEGRDKDINGREQLHSLPFHSSSPIMH